MLGEVRMVVSVSCMDVSISNVDSMHVANVVYEIDEDPMVAIVYAKMALLKTRCIRYDYYDVIDVFSTTFSQISTAEPS